MPRRRTVLAWATAAGLAALPMIPNGAAAGSNDLLLRFDVVSSQKPAGPLLEIHRDGSVKSRVGNGTDALSQKELDALVTYLVDDLGFMALDGDRIEREIERLSADSNRIFSPADYGVTEITLSTAQGDHTVSFGGTSIAASTFPEIEDLQRLRKAEIRLLELVQTLQNG